METYSSYQDVKYSLKTRQLYQENRSINEFPGKGRLYSSINSSLLRNMRNAASLYKQENKKNRDTLKRHQEDFLVSSDATTEKKLKLMNEVEADTPVEKAKRYLRKHVNLLKQLQLIYKDSSSCIWYAKNS